MRNTRSVLANFCLFILIHAISPVFSLERDEIVINEIIISQDIEDFDCHSSSLIETSPGVLCAVWKGAHGQGKSNIDIKSNSGIWLSHLKNGGWTSPKQVVDAPNSMCWNPVLAKYPSGKLVLFYRVGPDPRDAISLYKSSLDEGIHWSPAEILPAGITGPTKGKPVFDSNENMICGSSVEVGAPEDAFKATACWIEILSSDLKWSKHGPLEVPNKRFGCIEPVLFWRPNGLLKMLCRDRSNRIGLEGWIWTAESIDGGKTWTELKNTSLPNPDAGIEALLLRNGNILLIYNHSHINRHPLTIALSNDGGSSWTSLCNIEDESGEFPSAVLDSQGLVHLIYAWSSAGKEQRRIKHIIMDFKHD